VVAVGTGQAIKNARNCDGGVLLFHAKPAEQKFVADGYGAKRHDLVYNDFVIVGPPSDLAKIAGGKNAGEALQKIAAAKALFASCGNDSGTHKKERTALEGGRHRSFGELRQVVLRDRVGHGATLNAGLGMGADVLTDRAAWNAFKNKGDFKIVVEGDKELLNQCGVILVSKDKCQSVKADLGRKSIDWLVSEKGQKTIADYKKSDQQLFFPNAN
jgi:tungstate transport system substrate-binding protein